MILRVVLIEMAEGRADVVARAREVFPTIPGVVDIEAGTTEDGVALFVWFASRADVEAYRVHPIHVAFVEDELRPRMTSLQATNVDLG